MKQLVKSFGEKESLTLLKQKNIFEELAKERMGELQNLSYHIVFNNLMYYFKSESSPQNISFKDSLAFYKNIKDGYKKA